MRYAFPLAILLSLSACEYESVRPASPAAERMIAANDWIGAVQFYQTELTRDPDNPSLRQGYFAVVEQAVGHFSGQAKRYADLNDFAAAEAQLSTGLVVVPDSTVLQDEMQRIRDMKSARAVFRDASAAARLGRRDQAITRLETALSLDPEYNDALDLLDQLSAEALDDNTISPIRLRTGAPVTLNFRDASFKEAVLALGQAYGVNMIFDNAVQDSSVTIYAENVEFTQAFELLLRTNDAFYRRLGKNSVVIAPDTPDARAEYEDYLVRTFYLDNAPAQDIADLIARSLGLQNVSANEDANTVTVRDSRERLALADKLVQANDRAPAEVVMEVEILEIDRTKSEQLGLDFGSQIRVTTPDRPLRELNSPSDLSSAVGASVVNLPAVTLRYFKEDVDANTLASPRIRTLNKREASILIGDRVPLRSSTIVDATGQTRTTFEYTDVGVKLEVTPEVQLNRSVLVKMTLDVSSLGDNLGTVEEPAFAIGTRTVTTEMVLEDTETAVIGGLIRDEERDSIQSVPGLGRIPAVGRVFRSRDGRGTRTDILLTLTPRIIRGRDVPARPAAEFYSGSGNRVTTENRLDFLASSSATDQPTIRLDLSGFQAPTAGVGLPEAAPPAAPNGAADGSQASLGFPRTSYSVERDGTVDIELKAEGMPDGVSGTAIIRFRANVVEAVAVNSPENLPAQVDNTRGEIRLTLTPDIAGPIQRTIATLTFRGVEQGTSYLIFEDNFGSGGPSNIPEDLDIRASRISVR